MAAHRVKIRISTMVTTADTRRDPRQPNRLEKKKNISQPSTQACVDRMTHRL